MSHLNSSPQSGRPCYISLHRHWGRPSTTGFESITILSSASSHLQKLHCELREDALLQLWCLGRALPCQQEWVRSSENVPESQQELNLCRIRGDHWPTSVEVVGNRSRGGRRGHRWFSFLAQVELAAYHDSQFVTCVARFVMDLRNQWLLTNNHVIELQLYNWKGIDQNPVLL